VLVRASDVAVLPQALTPDRAAALPVNGLTARQSLDWLKLSAGERMLLTNGAGGTGALALQLAVAAGVIVTATASPRSFERLRQLGADQVVDYHSETWTSDLDGVFDAALATAPGTAVDAARVVRPGGRLCSITSDAPSATEQLATTDIYVQPDANTLALLATQLRDGLLDLPVEVVPLEDGPAAFDRSTTGRTGGTKIVLDVSGPHA
jgi:NADPH:quinone reductase-like Zn-dependent oxidoreductase